MTHPEYCTADEQRPNYSLFNPHNPKSSWDARILSARRSDDAKEIIGDLGDPFAERSARSAYSALGKEHNLPVLPSSCSRLDREEESSMIIPFAKEGGGVGEDADFPPSSDGYLMGGGFSEEHPQSVRLRCSGGKEGEGSLDTFPHPLPPSTVTRLFLGSSHLRNADSL